MLTAIYKYIFQPFTVCFMILKNKNTFVFTFPRLCVVSLIQIYHRTSSIPLMYKATCLLLVSTVKTIILPVSVTFSVYLNKIHGRLRKNHGRLLLVSFT